MPFLGSRRAVDVTSDLLARGLADKQILTIGDLAILHSLSRRTVIRPYENEPGVQILQASRAHQQRIGRHYCTIRVPRHVHLRVKHRLEVV
jgi:hypothetical protein